MKVKGITDECFSDYKVPSLFIAFPSCSFKCDKDNGCQLCQNSRLALEPDIDISKEALIQRYIDNPITSAIVCGGLEPFDSLMDLAAFVDCARRQFSIEDPIVIYTGYTEDEIKNWPTAQKTLVDSILSSHNIIVKYGRFRPDQPSHYDSTLGVNLVSPNQYSVYYE